VDHLVGIHSAEKLASLKKIDVGVLERYNREVGVDARQRREIPRRHTTRLAVEGEAGEGGARDDALGAPLTAHELERLTSVYREDHPGAEIQITKHGDRRLHPSLPHSAADVPHPWGRARQRWQQRGVPRLQAERSDGGLLQVPLREMQVSLLVTASLQAAWYKNLESVKTCVNTLYL
jgi:hypothetical protein